MANVLVIGSGGREHALCWRLSKSPSVSKLFCSPGNGGIEEDAVCVPLNSHDAIVEFCRKEAIELVVIGPEQPLVEGLADRLMAEKIPVFGPNKRAARLEGSKGFTKGLCKKYNIPTAGYGFFTDPEIAKRFLAGKSYPIVVKADGLAAGKGVVIAMNEAEAMAAVDTLMDAPDKSLVIEEFMEGEEVSFFALCDGKTAVPFGEAQDHKRAYDGDTGPNTGGMGTYSPTPVMNAALAEKVMQTIILPTVDAMKSEGAPFTGVLFAGLMLTKGGPQLLEYNVRFGDPETQVLMARFEGDLYKLLFACATGTLSETNEIAFSNEAAVCVVMAAKGYPGAYEKGSLIGGLSDAARLEKVKVFHAGTQKKGDEIIATGGRVLGITAMGGNIAEAQALAYRAAGVINWPEGFYRKDIAWRALSKKAS